MHVTIRDAQTQLSTLIEKAKAGEEVIITVDDTEVQLVPKPQPLKEPRKPGAMKGEIWMAPDFNTFGDEEAEMFGMKD